MTDRFDICWPYVLAQEGKPGARPQDYPAIWTDPANFSNDAHDAGGETFNGIIQREYTAFRKLRGLPSRGVKLCDLGEGHIIYTNNYWLPHCPDMPAGFDLSLFDANTNEGEHEATQILQHVLGCPIDGLWGPVTNQALAQFKGTTIDLINSYTLRRKAVYREMKGFPYFGRDWLRRADQIGAQSLSMV